MSVKDEITRFKLDPTAWTEPSSDANHNGDPPLNFAAEEERQKIPKVKRKEAPPVNTNFTQTPQAEDPLPALSGRSVLDYLDIFIDPKTNLAGNRWLTSDGSAFIIAPSGHGKSSLALQLAIYWALGRIVFGIKPARPLKILIVQSEDDDAVTKKFVQMIRKMNLSEAEKAILKENIRFEYHRSLSGDRFLKSVDGWLTEWPADITIINPLSGFLLCDLKDDDKVNVFLRDKLTSVMEKHKCAPIVLHHTPKINFTRLENMQWYDWMYAMSGCAGLTNWGRAVLVIAPSKLPGTYRFIAAKRFDEIQWCAASRFFVGTGQVQRRIISWELARGVRGNLTREEL
jgi:AAA domain